MVQCISNVSLAVGVGHWKGSIIKFIVSFDARKIYKK